jgi:transcriptional regulator
MYLPDHFRADDPDAIFDFVARHGFALLTTVHDGVPFTSHLPLLVERPGSSQGAGPHGTIIGHMARANPQWRDAAGQTGLVVFVGPHAYISPTWYAEPNTVPTWNYTAVHAYGRLAIDEDPQALKQIVARTTAYYEAGRNPEWNFDAGGTFVDGLVKQIVGFRMTVERWEAKFKLNQNHPQARRERVITALEAEGDSDGRKIATMMKGGDDRLNRNAK